ncbi:MAG: galactose mutarotase [Desulfobacterales bacterium]|nr:galactose mutarotase [Desulfobacterales bacterium]
MQLSRETFGQLGDKDIDLYTIANGNGLVVGLTNYGGIITSIKTPDRQGMLENIVLGYDSLEEYVNDTNYMGCLVGRYANRISRGCFQIDGRKYKLTCNDGANHLHGGAEGFNKKVWEAQPVREPRGCGVALSYTSPDGEEGYPGTVDIQVFYLLTADNGLLIEYNAATDNRTIVNLTQQSYFNLAGDGTILDHLLCINASGYTPVDSECLPTGSLKSVENSSFDFRAGQHIGQALSDTSSADLVEGGFDHNFVLDHGNEKGLPAAYLCDPLSGRTMEVFTSQPGLQFYTGNFLTEHGHGGNRIALCKHGGLCLEGQHFPDSPNQRAFPSVILEAGQVYHHITRYQFGVRDKDE